MLYEQIWFRACIFASDVDIAIIEPWKTNDKIQEFKNEKLLGSCSMKTMCIAFINRLQGWDDARSNP